MRSQLETYELIDRYLNNQLTADELFAFEKKMENDSAFRQEVDDHRLIHDMVVDHGLMQLRKKLQALDPPAKNYGLAKWIGAALVITVVCIISFYALRNDKVISEGGPAAQPLEEHAAPRENNNQPIESESTLSSRQQKPADNIYQTDTTASPTISFPPLKEDIQTELPSQRKDTLRTTGPVTPEISTPIKIEPGCDIHLSEIVVTTVESCRDTPDGKIVIDKRSILKGKAPFSFSIDNARFINEFVFDNLYTGSYQLNIKDANGCSWTYDNEIFIGEKECRSSEYSIYPAQGELWKIPLDENASGRIEIYNNNGARVYSAIITNGSPDTWDGTSNGQPLPMGSYSFILKSGSKVLTGTVTIIR